MREPQLRRHDLIWIEPSAWASTLAAAPQWRGEPLLADWTARGWPLIVRRPQCNEAADLVPVGLPLPPAAGKKRVGFAFPPAAIVRYSPPPLIADMIQSAPASWRPCIDPLLRLDAGVRAYGSLAWEHLTGLAYLSTVPTSTSFGLGGMSRPQERCLPAWKPSIAQRRCASTAKSSLLMVWPSTGENCDRDRPR